MNRRPLLAILLSAVLLFTAGCWSRVEVNDLAIVTMMAVDRTEEGELAIWAHVAIPGRAGAAPAAVGGGGSDGPPLVTLHGRGKTVTEATKMIQQRTPRRLFWAHMRVILIGERLARDGVRPALDFLTRHRELRLTNWVLTARGEPRELMAALVDLEKQPMEYIREISRSRIGIAVNLGDFARMLASPGADPVMGVVQLMPPPPGSPPQQKPTLAVTGTALYRDDKLAGFMEERETGGILCLRGESHRDMATVEVSGTTGSVTVAWQSTHTERTAAVENGRITIRVKTRIEGDIFDSQPNLDLSDPKVIAAVQERVAKVVQQRIQDAWGTVRELNTDAAGFGDLVHQQMPAVWHQVEKRWLRSEAQRVNVLTQVDVNVRRTGMSSKPRGVPAEELEKVGE